MSDTTTSTFYVHATVLGGKTIAELDQFGVKVKGYVYAGGARMATQTVYGSSNSVQIESTNPVTGAAIVTDANGSSATRQEPDPLGRELSQAPDPTVGVDPLSSSKWNDPMPIEYSGGPSAEYEQANAARAAQMDAYGVEQALFYGHRATWDWILHKNPNVGIRTSGGRTLYGGDAADYLASSAGLRDELVGQGVTTNKNISIKGSGSPQNTLTAAHQTQVQDGIAGASNLLTKPGCGNFVDDLLQRAASQVRWTSLDYVSTGGRYGGISAASALQLYQNQLNSGAMVEGGSGSGTLGTIYAKTNPNTFQVTLNRQFFHDLNHAQIGFHTLHESFHQLKGFTDEILANAASWVDSHGKTLGRVYAKTDDGVSEASQNFNRILSKYCPDGANR